MAVRKLENGNYQVDWYLATGERKRKNFPKKALADRFAASQKLFENTDNQGKRELTFRELP